MIHQYKSHGYNIVMDVNSSAVHVVDDVVYDMIPVYEKQEDKEAIFASLDSYPREELEAAYEEITRLKNEGMLYTEDIYQKYMTDFKKRKTVVKALCLHIAHDCNLACKYCFAEEGEYHGRRALMSLEVGKKALDFLVANSGNRRNLEVDFFGGEPLMNWDVVKELVKYGRSLEKEHNKLFRFTLTTNGVLLNDEVMEFCNKEMSNVVLSLDGRKEVNDKMRPFRNGKGSYDLIVPKAAIRQIIMSEEHLQEIILIFQRMCFIMLILVLSRCLWSRLLHHQRMIMQSVKKICRVSLKNMISLLMLIWNIEKLEKDLISSTLILI